MYRSNPRGLTLAALVVGLALSSGAYATNKCEFGGKWPNCNPPPTEEPSDPGTGSNHNENSNTNSNTNQAGAAAGAAAGAVGVGVGYGQGGNADADAYSTNTNVAQGGAGGKSDATVLGSGNSSNHLGQAQGIDRSGNSASLSGASSDQDQSQSQAQSIGDTTSNSVSLSEGGRSDQAQNQSSYSEGSSAAQSQTSDASTSNAGNSNVQVDAADRSTTTYTAQALWLPTIETAAPALVASPTLVVDRGACGPRQDKRQERVNGTYVGILKRSSIDLGVDDELTAATEPYRYWTDPQGVTHVFGHQVITFASVNGVAASRALGLGGGKTGGDWGQAGVSSGSSVQRTILRIQLQECEIPLQKTELVIPDDFKHRVPRG